MFLTFKCRYDIIMLEFENQSQFEMVFARLKDRVNMSQLICQDLSFGYDGHMILEHLNFKVERGEYLCIVGENGSGKTTLMKTLLGLHTPLHGEVITGDGLKRNEIGYLPQQTAAQRDFPASVEEVVLSGCVNQLGRRFFYSKAMAAKAREKMRLLDIENLRNKSYRALSGGQQQRTLLARALCATDSLLLLDEPTSGLDPVSTEA